MIFSILTKLKLIKQENNKVNLKQLNTQNNLIKNHKINGKIIENYC